MVRIFRIATLLSFASLGSILLSSQSSNPNRSADGLRLGAVKQSEFQEFSSWPYVRWVSGKFLAFESVVTEKQSAVGVYDESGKLLSRADFWLPGVTSVTITDATIDSAGNIIVAGGTIDGSARVSNFVARISPSGTLERAIQTAPFVPLHVCTTADNNVWAYGFSRASSTSAAAEDNRVLRKVNFSEGLVKAEIASSQLSSATFAPNGHYPGEVSLHCNGSLVGLYVGSANRWVLMDTASGISRTLSVVPLNKSVRIMGSAMLASGQLYATLHDRGSGRALSGLFELRPLQDGSANWVVTPGTMKPFVDGYGQLLGRSENSSGSVLVYRRGRTTNIHWESITAPSK